MSPTHLVVSSRNRFPPTSCRVLSHTVRIIEPMNGPPGLSRPATVVAVTARAADVATQLRAMLPGAGTVKIHKLLYYVQGHHLAWHGTPAFSEPIEAWVNGPVVADLWRAERYEPPREKRSLDPRILEVVFVVVSRYGHLTGRDLIKLTHNEDPWRELAESDDDTTSPNTPIGTEALTAYFSDDNALTPAVRARVAEVATDTSWVPTGPDELDHLEATYARR